MALGREAQPQFAQPRPQQAWSVYQEHLRECPHCQKGRPCPVGRYQQRKALKGG